MSVLARVRTATRAVHHSLDSHPMLVRIMRTHDLAAYRAFLESFDACIKPAMPLYIASVQNDDKKVLAYQAWEEALQRDLQVLSGLVSVSSSNDFNSSSPIIEDASEFWGFLYVVEGSVLGGREVSAMLPESWPKEFLLRGSMNRLRWPYFLKRFAELENTGEIFPDAVEKGAVKTFSAMVEMFDRYLMEPKETLRYDYSASPQ